MSTKPTPELETFLLFDDMLIFSKELEDPGKFDIFETMRKEFEDKELLKELNEDENTSRQETI
jgi:hypothetical protein